MLVGKRGFRAEFPGVTRCLVAVTPPGKIVAWIRWLGLSQAFVGDRPPVKLCLQPIG